MKLNYFCFIHYSMQKAFLGIFLILFMVTAQAQDLHHTLDSLQVELKKHSKEDSDQVILFEAIALNYSYSSPDSGIAYAYKALTISERINYRSGILTSLRQLGAFYLNKPDLINALKYLNLALKAGKRYNEPGYVASINNNLGFMYLSVEDNQKALGYFFAALPDIKKSKETYVESYILNNIGLAYLNMNDNAQALTYLGQALVLADSLKLSEVLASVYLNLGIISKREGELDKALINFNKAISFSDVSDNKYIKAQSIGGVAEVLFEKKNYLEAEKFVSTGLIIAQSGDFLMPQRDIYKLQSDLFTIQNRFKDAFLAYRNYIAIRDSIADTDKKNAILRNELQTVFDNKENLLQHENARVKLDMVKQMIIRRWVTWIASVLILLFLAGIYLYKKRRDLLQKQSETELKSEVTEMELKALRAQMNPHFIFNSLNSISNFINTHHIELADDYITSFAKLMRLTLELSEERTISLQQELEHLGLYLKLEQQRLDHRFTYQFIIDDTVQLSEWVLPSLLLQPYVENSIVHGLSAREQGGEIKIKVTLIQNSLHILIDDNGNGRSESETTQKSKPYKSMGTSITRNRIRLFNQQYHTHATIEISDLTPGTRVELVLPILQDY